MSRLASLLVVTLMLLPAAANAQEPTSISPGARVRVWQSPTTEPLTGKVLKVDATSITLSVERATSPITVSRSPTARIDVSRGRRPTGRSVLLGALIGSALAAVSLVADKSEGPAAGVQYLLLPPIGIVLGAVVGEERWNTSTPMSANLTQAVGAPARSLRVTFRF